MNTVHGNHHRSRQSESSYKQSIQRWQSRVVLESLPQNEYVITEDGQFRCAICSGIPPFKTGSDLAAHIHGKRHQSRILNKKIIQTVKQEKITHSETSIAMPSILKRTREVMESVLNHTHKPTKRIKENALSSKQIDKQITTTQAIESSKVPLSESKEKKEPLWIQEAKKRKQEQDMLEKGFRKDENGKWYRDPTIEFDSDEEPTLENLV